MQVYLIVLIAVLSVVLLAINIYLLILYIHPDDKAWGTAIYSKILVVLGLTLCQAQALMVPLDVANRSAILPDSINMAIFWFLTYIIVLCFISILMPYAIFLYETDEDETICSRLLKALGYTFGALIISALILFLSWVFLKYVDIPYSQVTLNVDETGTSTIYTPVVIQLSVELEASLAVYIIAILSFFGWIFLVIFGGVGLFALPIDLINQFRHRPIARKTSQMTNTKKSLIKTISELSQQLKQLQKLSNNFHDNRDEAHFLTKFTTTRKINNTLSALRAEYHEVSNKFQLFKSEANLQKTNPVVPVLKLILGIIFFITSIVWIVQIVIGNIVKQQILDNRPLVPMLNELFMKLEEGNAGFISTGIFAYLCLYILWCVQKGNIKFGIRVPCCCRFHPMKINETWMNSFLFNTILMCIASVGVIQLCITSFPTYTRNTEIYMIFGVQIMYMKFYNAFYKYNVFLIALVAWSLISLVYLLVTCNKKPKERRKKDKKQIKMEKI